MKKILLALFMLLGVTLSAFSQNYTTECRAYRPKGQEKFGNCFDISVPVYISKTSVQIGNSTYKLWSTGHKSVAYSGDITYTYLAQDPEGKSVEIQINYIKETGKAKLIYIRYPDGEYCYILK